MKAQPTHPPRPSAYTEQDLCDYAHHLWVQAGMRFDGDPWEEARACLEANLPRCSRPDRTRARRATPRRASPSAPNPSIV